MTIITTATINDAIAATFDEIDGLYVQSYDELTDGIADLPLLQVYWQSFREDANTNTDRRAPLKAVVASEDVFHLDLYAAVRGELAQDIPKVIEWMDKLREKMYAQTSTYFGIAGIDAVQWEGRRVNLRYGNDDYAGARFELTVKVF